MRSGILGITLVFLGLLAFFGAKDWQRRSNEPPIGVSCIVQFDRNLLGANGSVPISPKTENQNGADTAVSGTLRILNDQWVMVEGPDFNFWIPRQAILMIESTRSPR